MKELGTADPVLDAQNELGEGPMWHDAALYWVNINAGEVHMYTPASGATSVIELRRSIGAVVPRRGGGLVGISGNAFGFIGADASFDTIAEVEVAHEGVRMNDGKCDPAGRFWAGTLDMNDFDSGLGALYVLEPDGRVRTVVEGCKIPNGMGWSPNAETMYFIDSLRSIDAFDFDVATGEIANRRTLVQIPEEEGLADGMCTDAEGYLWVAMWGGYCVRRYAPDGTLTGIVRTDAKQTSSCAFGGDDLRDLYITSATIDLNDDELKEHPHSGGLFRFRSPVVGQALVPFAG